MLEIIENLQLLKEDNDLHKGIFWIKDLDNIENNELYFYINCDNYGNSLDPFNDLLSSKSGKSFNHKNTWSQLPKKDTDGYKFDYYPRGRVEINNGKAIIFCNKNIASEELKQWCIDKFNLTKHNGIKQVIIKVDNSNHYQCYLDRI